MRRVVPYIVDGAGRFGLIQMSWIARPSSTQPKWHSPVYFSIVPSSRWRAVSNSQLPISHPYRSMSFARSAGGPSETRAARNGEAAIIIMPSNSLNSR